MSAICWNFVSEKRKCGGKSASNGCCGNRICLHRQAGERAGVWESGFGQDASALRDRPGVGPSGASRAVQVLRVAGAGTADRQARSEAGESLQAAERLRGADPRDIGYVQQNREEMEVLFTLLAERYERGSLMVTSNLPFSKWEGIFKDAMTTAAAIDRLVHHSVILEINLPSYRMEHRSEEHT